MTFRSLLENHTTGIFLGRFQPVTKAHYDIIKKMESENSKCVIMLVKGKKSSEDKSKNPFDEEIQTRMLKEIVSKSTEIKIIPTGFFPDYVPSGKLKVYAGTDRVKGYERMGKDLDMEIIELKRSDEDISATKVRQTLKDNDFSTFKRLTPKEIHNYFKELVELYEGQ